MIKHYGSITPGIDNETLTNILADMKPIREQLKALVEKYNLADGERVGHLNIQVSPRVDMFSDIEVSWGKGEGEEHQWWCASIRQLGDRELDC